MNTPECIHCGGQMKRAWKSASAGAQAGGCLVVILGLMFSMSILGAIVGIPLMFLGAIWAFSRGGTWQCRECSAVVERAGTSISPFGWVLIAVPCVLVGLGVFSLSSARSGNPEKEESPPVAAAPATQPLSIPAVNMSPPVVLPAPPSPPPALPAFYDYDGLATIQEKLRSEGTRRGRIGNREQWQFDWHGQQVTVSFVDGHYSEHKLSM